MLPVFVAVPGSRTEVPPGAAYGDPSTAPRRPVPTAKASPSPPRFYSYGYLIVTAGLMAIYCLVTYFRPHSVVEIPLGLFALLFAPGYALAAPLFGRQPGLTWIVNLPITVALSVVFNVLVGIVLLRGGPGLRALDTAVVDLVATLFGLIVFTTREVLDPAPSPPSTVGEDLSGPLRVLGQRARMSGYSGGQRAVAVTLLVLILLVFGFIVYVAVAEPHKGLAVSLAMSGPGGTVASLPTNGTDSSVLTVVLTVSNGATAQVFEINVTSELTAHPNAVPTATTWAAPLSLGRATYSTTTLSFLGVGKNVTVPVSFVLTPAGTVKQSPPLNGFYSLYTVSFTLETTTGVAIQSLQLPLNITSEA
jgi:uncharacterized membrane protein